MALRLSVLLLLGALVYHVHGGFHTREYYVAIEEIEWDYAPSGRHLMKNIALEDDEDASVFTATSGTTIGRVYKKAVFREYTDGSFTKKAEREEHWGLIGPPLKAEVGDKLIVHVKNTANRVFSMHPHGVFYNKTHEGALYHDKTSQELKHGDRIAPGASFTYHWDVLESFGPADDEPNCLTWAYHSHTTSDQDTNSGLIGPIVICRPGTIDELGNRSDVDKEFYFLFTVLDENLSWYLEENIQKYCTNPDDVDIDDEHFQESNKMHGINGLMYGNLGGLSVCKGESIAIYLFGFGTEVDIHSVHFHGQTVITQGHRQDTISLFPGIFATALLEADNPGTFKLTCAVNDHISAGMSTKLSVNQCEDEAEQQQQQQHYHQEPEDGLSGNVRNFFIGIREESWNYGPTGQNPLLNSSLTEEGSDSATFFERGADRIGGVYKKAIFHEYESGAFKVNKTKPNGFGVLGPLISVEVGDTVRVILKNFAASKTYNIEPHGVFYNDLTHVGPGGTHTYEWNVPDSVAPTDIDGHCVTYIYTSSVDPVKDTNSGLAGPILVCKRGTLESNLERRSLYFLFTVFDENSSHYIEENIETFTSDPESVDTEDADFVESNLMHSINGLMYGNLDVNLCRYAETDVHVLAIGTEVDLHSFYMGGTVYKFRNEYTSVLNVFPHTTASTVIKPTALGSGDIACVVADHFIGGMWTLTKVRDCGLESETSTPDGGVTRTYYVAAVEEVWDYAPWKEKLMDSDLSAFTKKEKGRFIGSKYWKAIFYEYADETFTTRKKKPEHLGLLGPILSAEEGDTIKVVFKNDATMTYNILPTGVEIEEFFSRGAEVPRAAPGETVTYVWKVPKASVPTEDQPACNAHYYVSVIDEIIDMYSGLIGPMLICRKGGLSEDGWMRGTDAEFFLTFMVFDETNSYYIDRNIRDFAEADPDTFDKEDEEFLENNLMHGINGRLGHLEGLKMYEGDRVIWHLLGTGNEVDMHTVHFHAHAYKYISDYTSHADVFSLFPGKEGTVEMMVTAIGSWLLHCHVNDHMVGGMTTTYTVLPETAKTTYRTPCYARRRWSRKQELHCMFESPRDLEDLLDQAAENQIKVCPSRIRSDDGYTCQTIVTLPPKYIFMLNMSSTFSIEAENFRNLMSKFARVRYIYANDIGLRFLHPSTFSRNSLLLRIFLRRNQLQQVPFEIFSRASRLRAIDLRDNNLEWNGMTIPAETFRGLRARVDLRNNPKLGRDQRVFRNTRA